MITRGCNDLIFHQLDYFLFYLGIRRMKLKFRRNNSQRSPYLKASILENKPAKIRFQQAI